MESARPRSWKWSAWHAGLQSHLDSDLATFDRSDDAELQVGRDYAGRLGHVRPQTVDEQRAHTWHRWLAVHATVLLHPRFFVVLPVTVDVAHGAVDGIMRQPSRLVVHVRVRVGLALGVTS